MTRRSTASVKGDVMRDEVTILGVKLDTRLNIIVFASTMLLLTDEYHAVVPADTFATSLRSAAAESVLLYLAIPAALVLFVFRDSLRDYGFQFGDWRAGLKWTAGVLLVLSPLLFFAANTSEVQDYYARSDRSTLDILIVSGSDLFAWEFLFRGFLFFGLYRVVGPSAIMLQAVPFAMAHLGKPELETMTTVLGGAGFGWIAWRTNSFFYPFLIHWGLNVFVRVVATSG